MNTALKELGYLVKLTNRSLLVMRGANAYEIIQGISTQDVNILKNNKNIIGIHTAFLNLQGRIVADAFLSKPQIKKDGKIDSAENELWLDCDREFKDDLKKHIKRYILRKKASIEDVSDSIDIYSIISPLIQSETQQLGTKFTTGEDENQVEEGSYANYGYFDPRAEFMGIRLQAGKDQVFHLENEANHIEAGDRIKKAKLETYDKIRIMNGIAEGRELRDVMHLTANIDFTNSVSFSKGCYVAQETVARSYHTGVVTNPEEAQKKVPTITPMAQLDATLPVFDSTFNEDLTEQPVLNQNGRTVGKIIRNINNVGLAIMNYINLESQALELFVGQNKCTILYNPWLHKNITSYQKLVSDSAKLEI